MAFITPFSGTGEADRALLVRDGAEADLLAMLKKNFKSVVHVKPPASRSESVEMYLLAKGFKGRPDETA